MKPIPMPTDSTSQRTHWKFPFLALILTVFFNSFSLAANEETPKDVRRSSAEADVSIPKGQKRIALVIGNSDYKVGPLRNPTHDAEDISGVLRTLGFAVQTKTNVNQREMDDAVDRFVQEIQDGDVALFYFSGHGVQVKGENYLIPLGDIIQSEADVRYKTVNAGLVLEKMEESRNRANIVILDACRNNPFKGLFRSPSLGLSKMDAPKGTFIAYATAPNSVAADGEDRNSPYTKHLIEALKVKDIPIEQAFKLVARGVNKETGGQQTPWISSSLLDDFYCNPSSPVHPQVASLPSSSSPGSASAMSSEYKKKAERLWALSVTSNDASAREELSRMFEDAEAVKWFRQAADQGDAVAQLWLGQMYARAPKDSGESSTWFRKSAEQGNAMAQHQMGGLYYIGRGGVPKDYRESVKWTKKAAEQGFRPAQHGLANMYKYGYGVPQDYPEAMKWYKKAAEQGDTIAQWWLGDMYENGYGVPKDNEEAAKWYIKSGQLTLRVQKELARWYRDGIGVRKDYGEAVKWLKKAADQGDAAAQSDLGWMYHNGFGVAKDYEEAVRWFMKAAEQGDMHGQYNLGLMYKNGHGVAKDRGEARNWFTKAADQGYEEAKKELRKMGATSAR
jgi:TPR repeat protein